MAGRAGRPSSNLNDDRPPEPPPPLPGVSQRSRFSSEGGRERPEHNIPDEGLRGIVAAVRAKAPRESSPTPATRLPGGRDGRSDRSPSASRAASAGRNGRQSSPTRPTSAGTKSGRPPPPLPPSASKASKSAQPPPMAGEQRKKSPPRPPSAKTSAARPGLEPDSPLPLPPYASQQERERRSLSPDSRQGPRVSSFSGIQPTSSPAGGGLQKGSPSKVSPQKRQSSFNMNQADRRSPLSRNKLSVGPDTPLLAGDTPVDPEDFAETADSGFYQETTDDDRSWANRASLGSLGTSTEAPTPIATPMAMGRGFEFGTWPGLSHPVGMPTVPGFVQGMAPIPGFLSPPRFGAAGRGAPRALVPPLPLGSAVDLAQMARGGMKSPLSPPPMLSPTLKVPPFPMHSLSLDSSMTTLSIPSSPLRSPSGEFRPVPPPLAMAMVQLGQPAWTPGSPAGAMRSGRARSSSPMRQNSRASSPMRMNSRTFAGEEGTPPTAPPEQAEASNKAPVAIPLQSSLQPPFLQLQQLRPRSMSPRPALGPPRRSLSPQQVRAPRMFAHPMPSPWMKPMPSPLRGSLQATDTAANRAYAEALRQVNAAFAPPMVAARSMSPLQNRMRGFGWSTPLRGGPVLRVGSPLRAGGVLSPPRSPPHSPVPGSPHRAAAVPSVPAGMLSYAGSGSRQNMYASSESLGDNPSGSPMLLPEQAAAPEQETAYPRSPTGSPRLVDADKPLSVRPNIKAMPQAGTLQQAEEDFMRRWRDLQSTDGEDEQEAFMADSPSEKVALAGSPDPAAAVAVDNVLEAAGKRRGRRSIRTGQPAQRRAGR